MATNSKNLNQALQTWNNGVSKIDEAKQALDNNNHDQFVELLYSASAKFHESCSMLD